MESIKHWRQKGCLLESQPSILLLLVSISVTQLIEEQIFPLDVYYVPVALNRHSYWNFCNESFSVLPAHLPNNDTETSDLFGKLGL